MVMHLLLRAPALRAVCAALRAAISWLQPKRLASYSGASLRAPVVVAVLIAMTAGIAYIGDFDIPEALGLGTPAQSATPIPSWCSANAAEGPVEPVLLAVLPPSADAVVQHANDVVVATRTLGQQVVGVHSSLVSLKPQVKQASSAQDIVQAFHQLQLLESPTRHAGLAIDRTVAALRGIASESGDAAAEARLAEVLVAKGELYVSLIKVLREVRSLAVSLQQYPGLRKAAACRPDLMVGLETLALRGAEDDSTAHFEAGMYLSHAAVGSGRVVPLFSDAAPESAFALDSWGSRVPAAIAKAEELLLRGQPTSAQSVEIARRFFEHAQQFLTNVDSVALNAERRYRAAARFAADGLRPKLAAQMLARLGYFLALRGRHTDALATVDAALEHAEDPLAAHLRATLRRSLGELRTAEGVNEAIGLLERAEGHLPPLGQLEEQRAAAHAEMVQWGNIAGGGLRACFTELADFALVLICVLCRVVYGEDAAVPAAVGAVQG